MKNYNLDESLLWDITETPVYNAYGEPIDGFKCVMNNATNETLQVVTKSYQPVSNRMLVECAETVATRSGLVLEGYASFKGGRKVLAYLRDPERRSMAGSWADDFMIIGNSHDKSTAFFTGLTNRIHRCENMFSVMNMQNRISHTLGNAQRISRLMHATDLYYNAKTGMYEEMDGLESVHFDGRTKDRFVETVLRLPEGSIMQMEELPTRTVNRIDGLMDCIDTEVRDCGRNLLGLFNGATRYSSHHFQSKERMFGSPFGRVAEMNRDALTFCRKKVLEYEPVLV